MKNLAITIVLIASMSLGCKMVDQLRSGGTKEPAPNSNSNSSAPTPNGSPMTGTVPDTGSITAGADPKAEILAASKRFVELPFFTAHMTSEGDKTMNIELSYKAPDRYRFTTKRGTGEGIETLMFGNETYVKAGGAWRKIPGGMAGKIPSIRDYFTAEGMKTLKDVKYEGEDTYEGKPAYKYSYESAPTKDVQYPFTSTIWVSRATGVPMAIDVDYDGGPLKSVKIVYDTETPVTIEYPQT